MTQKGLKLFPSDVGEVPVPRPSTDGGHIEPSSLADLLKGADPQHLLVAAVPLSEAAGRRVVLVYDAAAEGPPNPIASRLTLSLDSGLEVQVKGEALAFYARPGRDLGAWEWQQLDNAAYALLAEHFNEGRTPSPADVQRVVEGLRSGAYDFSRTREGEEGEDVNKDDAGEDLQDALLDS